VTAVAKGMEIIIGDGSLVTYDGGDNAARALYFCVSHQVDEEENCVQEVLRMSRVLNETATSKKSVWCATGDESCTRECGPHDTKVSGENRAIIQSLSAVDDYFEAPSWRPRGEAMVDAVYTRVVEEGAGYVVFPRYFTEVRARARAETRRKRGPSSFFRTPGFVWRVLSVESRPTVGANE
jgi:hypothetical protein